jgi:hypothetical protein
MHRTPTHLSWTLLLVAACLALAPAAHAADGVSRIQILSDAQGPGPAVRLLQQDSQGLVVEFELPALESQSLTVAGETYQVLAIEGGGTSGVAGEPMLPTFTRLIQIPDRAGVQYETISAETRELSGYRPMPLQSDEGTGFTIDAAAYARAGYGAAERATVGEPALMRGRRVVPITFSPVRYDPARGSIEVAGRTQVRVSFAGVDLRNAGHADTRPVPESFDRLYRELLVNYEPERGGPIVSRGTWVLLYADNANVLTALQPLIEWRTRQGFEVHVVSTAVAGTTKEAIQAWLQNAYATWPNPPEYITLVGDVSGQFPFPFWRETYTNYQGETDHPYVQLDGTDILADAHIGRLSANTIDQLNLIVYKIVSYESTPYMTDPGWYGRACLTGDPQDSGYTCVQLMQWLKDRLRHVGYAEEDTIFSEPFVSQMTSKLNRGDTIFCYRGIMGMSGFTTGNISTLTNGRKMPFAVNLTCDTGSFASGDSRSEAWLNAGSPPSTPTGGIASIGTATTGTHTRYNNSFTCGILHALYWEGMDHFGEALTRGKYEMYVNYATQEMSYCQRFTCWNNLMGDAAGELWTGLPAEMTVTHPAHIDLGASGLVVGVTESGAPCAGAYVCLWKGSETFVGGYTDESGLIDLPINAATVGDMKITVTKHDRMPYLATIPVTATQRYVGYLADMIEDDGIGGSSGNGDHVANPGETIALRVEVKNYGLMNASGVTGVLSSTDPYVTILDGNADFGDVPGGGTVWGTDLFGVRIDGGTPDGHVLHFALDLSAGSETWHSVVSLPISAAAFDFVAVTLSGFGTQIDPGETGTLTVRLRNGGGAAGTGVQGTLTSQSPWVQVGDPNGAYGTVGVGATVENMTDPFGVHASADCFPGHVAGLRLVLQFGDAARDTVYFAVTVGSATSTDPTGPDRYGYYAFDNTDTGYEWAPTYQWIEIAPNHGGGGTSVGLSDSGGNQGDTHTLSLPFPFQYYGKSFTRVSICSNGWLAMGSTYITNYHNWNIPGAGAPPNMIAPMWDDLYQNGSDQVYYLSDAANHRYIVQWSRLRNGGGNHATSNFEVILYDPAYYPTATGDGIIDFQYDTFSNVDYEQMYSTVGIENEDQTDGVMYSYFNYYNAGGTTITPGRAIRFMTLEVTNPAGAGGEATPLRLALHPARPNPFGAGGTTLLLDLPRAGEVRLGIFDAAGRRVRALADGRMAAGPHRVAWNGCDDADRPVGAGVYFSVLEIGEKRITRPLTLVR